MDAGSSLGKGMVVSTTTVDKPVLRKPSPITRIVQEDLLKRHKVPVYCELRAAPFARSTIAKNEIHGRAHVIRSSIRR